MSTFTPNPSPQNSGLFLRSYGNRRTLVSTGLSILAGTLTLIACVPLFSVLITLIYHGGGRIIHNGLQLLTALPPTAIDLKGGGFGNALVGTLVMVIMASLLAVPFGVLGAIFLAEYAPRDSRISTAVRLAAKVLTGLPSILAGVFAYAAVVIVTGGFSAFAGALALSVLMIPIVILTAEEAILMVPAKMRHAAFGMGATKAQVIWKVVVPTAFPGILTGVMLAVARASGETAPLIFTALASNYSYAINGHFPFFHLAQPTASMAVFIYNASGNPSPNFVELAWTASLVLVVMVLAFNVGGQYLSHKSRPRS